VAIIFLNAVFGSIARSGHAHQLVFGDSQGDGGLPTLEFQNDEFGGIPEKLTNSLATNLHTSEFQPDYSQDVDEVYKGTAILCLGELASRDDPNAENRHFTIVGYHGWIDSMICC
jgi:hypothetical protein